MSRYSSSSLSKHRRNLARWGIVLAVIGFLLAAFQLHHIGSPPTIRVDALWVRDHQLHVQLLIAELVLAIFGWIMAFFFSRSKRWIGVSGFVVFIVLVIVYSGRLLIIADVLWKHGR